MTTETKFTPEDGMKTTPGPWRVISSGLHVVSDDAPGHTVVVRTGLMEAAVDTPKQCRERWEADAHLIAAAPELFEALEDCITALEPYDDIKPRDWKTDRENLRRVYQSARAALAKARGES